MIEKEKETEKGKEGKERQRSNGKRGQRRIGKTEEYHAFTDTIKIRHGT